MSSSTVLLGVQLPQTPTSAEACLDNLDQALPTTSTLLSDVHSPRQSDTSKQITRHFDEDPVPEHEVEELDAASPKLRDREACIPEELAEIAKELAKRRERSRNAVATKAAEPSRVALTSHEASSKEDVERAKWEERALSFLAMGNARCLDGTPVVRWVRLQSAQDAAANGVPLSDENAPGTGVPAGAACPRAA